MVKFYWQSHLFLFIFYLYLCVLVHYGILNFLSASRCLCLGSVLTSRETGTTTGRRIAMLEPSERPASTTPSLRRWSSTDWPRRARSACTCDADHWPTAWCTDLSSKVTFSSVVCLLTSRLLTTFETNKQPRVSCWIPDENRCVSFGEIQSSLDHISALSVWTGVKPVRFIVPWVHVRLKRHVAIMLSWSPVERAFGSFKSQIRHLYPESAVQRCLPLQTPVLVIQ